jgi:hypothetical protein
MICTSSVDEDMLTTRRQGLRGDAGGPRSLQDDRRGDRHWQVEAPNSDSRGSAKLRSAGILGTAGRFSIGRLRWSAAALMLSVSKPDVSISRTFPQIYQVLSLEKSLSMYHR